MFGTFGDVAFNFNIIMFVIYAPDLVADLGGRELVVPFDGRAFTITHFNY